MLPPLSPDTSDLYIRVGRELMQAEADANRPRPVPPRTLRRSRDIRDTAALRSGNRYAIQSMHNRGVTRNPYPATPVDYNRACAAIRRAMGSWAVYRRRSPFVGTNFITPDVIGRYRVGAAVVEVSIGTGITPGTYVIGMTVARERDAATLHDLCTTARNPAHLQRLCDDLAAMTRDDLAAMTGSWSGGHWAHDAA